MRYDVAVTDPVDDTRNTSVGAASEAGARYARRAIDVDAWVLPSITNSQPA